MYEKTIKYIFITACVLMAVIVMTAWGDDLPDTEPDTGMLVLDRTPLSHSYSDPAMRELADTAGNIITDSDSVLKPLMEKLLALRSGADSVVSVLHIGDSHVQAGYWTARLRELFQNGFGNAGRGLIVPYKLAGGNEPRNYSIKTPYKYLSGKAVDKRTEEPAGMTGARVTFAGAEAEFEIWSKEPFNAVTVFHHERAPLISAPETLSPGTYCIADNTPASTRIVLSETADTVRLRGRISMEYDNPAFYGFSLENGRPGVLYHAVGANSAAFEHIASNTTILEGGADALRPDLIIISLGTNNCYGRNYRSDYFRDIAENFLRKIKEAYPYSAVLLTTPMESCQRKSVKGRRTYVPNPNIPDVARVLAGVAADNGAASWDMYKAAGGKDINEVWAKKGLMGRDRIHLSESGYVLQGDMLYDAFVKYYNNYVAPGTNNGAERDMDSVANNNTAVR